MPKNNDAVLIISPWPQPATVLCNILDDARLTVPHSHDCRRALERLARPGISAVICEKALPDGDWKDVLDRMGRAKSSPALIVTSQAADDSLWAEVLNLGGYDVLAQPFDREEVTRIVTSAVRASAREAVQ